MLHNWSGMRLFFCAAKLLASVAVTSIVATAYADTQDLAKAGSWDTFGGTDSAGNEVCGMSTSWDDGRSFLVKRYENENHVTIQALNPRWSIDSDTVPISMTLGDNEGWTATALVRQQAPAGIQFTIPALRIIDFINEFVSSDSMVLVMGDNEVSWHINLSGTEVVIKAFSSCINEMSEK